MITVTGLSAQRGGRRVLNDLSLSVKKGELVSLVGPSGSGKTSLLRIIAGLDCPEEGEVTVGGRRANGDGFWLPPMERGVSMIFQDLALWPHMKAADQIAFVAKGRKGSDPIPVSRKVDDLLSLFHLEPLRDRYPDQLSGGEKQRLALARALASAPRCLLMDEPFSHLDDLLRDEFIAVTRELNREQGLTILYVTHNLDEAFRLAHRIAVLGEGKVIREWDLSKEGRVTREDVLSHFREKTTW